MAKELLHQPKPLFLYQFYSEVLWKVLLRKKSILKLTDTSIRKLNGLVLLSVLKLYSSTLKRHLKKICIVCTSRIISYIFPFFQKKFFSNLVLLCQLCWKPFRVWQGFTFPFFFLVFTFLLLLFSRMILG